MPCELFVCPPGQRAFREGTPTDTVNGSNTQSPKIDLNKLKISPKAQPTAAPMTVPIPGKISVPIHAPIAAVMGAVTFFFTISHRFLLKKAETPPFFFAEFQKAEKAPWEFGRFLLPPTRTHPSA